MDFEQDKRSWRTILLAGLAFIAITVILTIAIEAIGKERIQAFVQQAGAFAPLVYIALRMASYIVAPLSTGPVQFAAGVLFGLWPGVIYSIIGEALGGSANFWIARKLGRPVVRRLAGDSGMARIEKFYQQAGQAWTLVYARLFLFAIYDFLSYAAGFTPIKYRQYLLITVGVGIVPTFIAVAVGSTLSSGNYNQLLLLYAVLAVLAIVPMVFYRRIRRVLKLEPAGERK
ncbi:MAG TPA: VTT domain-containing protein [Phototrophicaceae bacterium]|nr:VTT domain-containing protein [Phototrophicaceae bacterium]